jgi:hypothetical protein
MLDVEHYQKIVPAQKLLGSVRVALLPDILKNLFRRHMHTRGMPTESQEEELLRVCVFCVCFSSLRKYNTKSTVLHLPRAV